MLPTVWYLVLVLDLDLDQNAFRKPHLLTPAIQRARATGAKLLIIDAAIMERELLDAGHTTSTCARRRASKRRPRRASFTPG
jgi:hypothetical protein